MALTKVSSSLVSDNAVTSGKIADGGIATADIANVAVTTAKIANNAILTQHIDDGQVTTDQLGADAVTAAKIADDAISEEHLDVTVITSLTAVTAATGDLLMVADVSDYNNLKKIPVSSILAGTHTGAVNTSGTINSGAITSTGDVIADTHFNSTDTNATLSATGTGNVYLRPNGKSSSSGQVHVASTGLVTLSSINSGSITTTSDIFIPVGNKLYFGGANHTYISEDINDRLRFFTGGAEFMRFTEGTTDSVNIYKDTIFSGNLHAGDDTDISMDANANGQLEVDGNGYQGAIALDGSAMHVYHNSSSRSLILGTNETARITIGGSGNVNFHSNNLTSTGTISSGAITSTGSISATTANSNLAVGDATFTSTNYSTVNVRGTTGGQLLLGRDSNANHYDFFLFTTEGLTRMGAGAGDSLAFHTNSTGSVNEAMRIDSNGQVMIGHTSSFAHADADNLAIGDGTNNSGLTIYTGASKESSIIFGNAGTNGNIEAGIKYYHESHGTVANRRAMTFATGGSMQERMRIDSSGNVGIGVTDPADKLEVNGGTAYPHIRITSVNNTSRYMRIGMEDAINHVIEANGSSTNLKFKTAGTDRVVIGSTGNMSVTGTVTAGGLNVSSTGGTELLVHNTDTNWAALTLKSGGNQANYIFFKDGSAERARIFVSDGNEISFQTGASPTQRLKISNGNDIVLGTGTVNEAAKVISSGGTTIIRAADTNHSIVLRGTQDASGNVTGNTNTMGFYEYGGYEFYTKQGNTRTKSLEMLPAGKVNIATSAPRSKYFDVNGVAEINESFSLNNGVQYDFEYTVTTEAGTGNSYFIIAGYNHFYNTSYGAHRVAFMSARGTSMASMINLGEQNSSGGGQWQFTKPTATTLRIRKTAGTYSGGGHGFIRVIFRNY